MKRLFVISLLLLNAGIYAQNDSLLTPSKVIEFGDYYIFEGDTLVLQLDEVSLPTRLLFKNKKDRIYFFWLRKKVHKAYPYAKLAQERLTVINKNLEKYDNKRLKKKYIRRMQKYFEEEYSNQLKNLTRTEGRILTKLIHRQMGITVYDMIKKYRSGWSAYWNNTTAKLFKLDLKDTYEPGIDNEDYLTELILEKAFYEGTLEPQSTVLDFDFDAIKTEHSKRLDVEYRIDW
ncbi:MAG: hypothetical protein CR968_03040 [Flavobacteriia bacterium]|nr:MAG: hypothetical protein CR968_03040 [Flavobacteriia bacterium]